MKFADTGWWVAWALPGDTRHEDALAMLRDLRRSEQILTTNLVAGETWTFLRRKDTIGPHWPFSTGSRPSATPSAW